MVHIGRSYYICLFQNETVFLIMYGWNTGMIDFCMSAADSRRTAGGLYIYYERLTEL